MGGFIPTYTITMLYTAQLIELGMIASYSLPTKIDRIVSLLLKRTFFVCALNK
jgi:hypothetical protein